MENTVKEIVNPDGLEAALNGLRDNLGVLFGLAVAELSPEKATRILNAIQQNRSSARFTATIELGAAYRVTCSIAGDEAGHLFEVEGAAPQRFFWTPAGMHN